MTAERRVAMKRRKITFRGAFDAAASASDPASIAVRPVPSASELLKAGLRYEDEARREEAERALVEAKAKVGRTIGLMKILIEVTQGLVDDLAIYVGKDHNAAKATRNVVNDYEKAFERMMKFISHRTVLTSMATQRDDREYIDGVLRKWANLDEKEGSTEKDFLEKEIELRMASFRDLTKLYTEAYGQEAFEKLKEKLLN